MMLGTMVKRKTKKKAKKKVAKKKKRVFGKPLVSEGQRIRPRSVGFNDVDWKWVSKRAKADGLTVSAFIQRIVKDEMHIESELGF